MSTRKPTFAKIIQHSEGLGVPTSENVQHRAEELALINGHRQFTADDWAQAKRELHGGHEPIGSDGAFEMSAAVSEHDMTYGSLGRQVCNGSLEDQENIVEELIAEGMDEAVHEQMLAARREEAEEDVEEES